MSDVEEEEEIKDKSDGQAGKSAAEGVVRESVATVYSWAYDGDTFTSDLNVGVKSKESQRASDASEVQQAEEEAKPTNDQLEAEESLKDEDTEYINEEEKEEIKAQNELEEVESSLTESSKSVDPVVDVEKRSDSEVQLDVVSAADDYNGSLEDELPTKFITIEETILDDTGKSVIIKQKIPILRETRRYERISVTEGEGEKTHKFLETITRVYKHTDVNQDGELEETEQETKEVIEYDERPKKAVTVYMKITNEKGNIEEVVLPLEEEKIEEVPVMEEVVDASGNDNLEKDSERVKEKKKILQLVRELEVEPCTYGKVREVTKPKITEVFVDDESELSDDEQSLVVDEVQRKRENKMGKLKDNLRTVLVRLALAEKKRNLYMQLISISSEVKEDLLNPPDPDRPSFRVPKMGKSEDKFRRLYNEKLMEYRELRSAILVKLAMEKKRKEEVKKKYDVRAAQVADLSKSLHDKLVHAISKLQPKVDPVFKNQSPQQMVKRVLELIERLDNETKQLMYKKKQLYLAKQKYDQVTENEQGLSYKYALASKEYRDLVSKNDRRNEKLESLKSTMQKECLAVTNINQKCEAILKTTDEKNAKLDLLNLSLNRARQDRKDVHQARRKVESELRQETEKIKVKNHPSLLKEYHLVEELLLEKQMEFQQLKRDCLSSLQKLKKISPNEKISIKSFKI